MDMDISTITLNHGQHDDPADGHCLLEVVSMFAGESFGDRPECVCTVLAAFGRSWNDGLPDDAAREQLRQYIPRLVGTKATSAIESQRAIMAVDWMLRVYTPTWLDRLPALRMHAAALRAHPEIVDTAGLISVLPIAVAARKDAASAWAAARAAAGAAARAAAWDAAWAAAGAAAGAAAWAAARAAAGAAAGAAAWAAAWDAARAAALDAAWDAAGDAARAAARAAAWDAAWAAAGAAAGAAAWAAARAAAGAAAGAAAWAAAWDAARAAALDAAWDAAGDALQLTVTELQASAHDLYDRMIRCGQETGQCLT